MPSREARVAFLNLNTVITNSENDPVPPPPPVNIDKPYWSVLKITLCQLV